MGRFEIVVVRFEIVVDRCGSLWDRCGSLWIVVGRCGSFRVLVTTENIENEISMQENLLWSRFCASPGSRPIELPLRGVR